MKQCSRRLWWKNALFVVLMLCPTAFLSAGEADAPPLNVVLILADDLGWSDVACYGGDLHETPHLDQLAADGMRFTAAYAASICSPTRASLLTGKHHARLGMTIWRESAVKPQTGHMLNPPPAVGDLPRSEVTIAEVLHDAGYRTALIGKWHVGGPEFYPETQGFDTNIGGTLWGAPASYFYPYRGPFDDELRYVPGLDGGTEGEYLTDRLTDEALTFIDQAGDRPFFLFLSHHAPHTPIQAKAELVDHYRRKLGPDFRHFNPEYAAMVHSLDESVGRVLAHLDDRGVADRTLVIFLSDNGGYLRSGNMNVTTNHPLRSGKGSLYEGGVRVPLIVRWPGVTTAGSESDQLASVADIYPTILSATGLNGDDAHNASMDGFSLAPLLRDSTADAERGAVYHHYPHYYRTTTPASGIRVGDWKLIEYFEDGRRELYNLANDIGETQNLADKETTRRDDLYQRLNEWRKSVNALRPTPNPDWKKQ